MNMKSIITLSALTFLAAFGLVGCNPNSPSGSSDTPTTNSRMSGASSTVRGNTNMSAITSLPVINTNLPATNSLPDMTTNLPDSTNK
jgi:uncharacterized lipoprotein NlpE involved in copper resistance